MASQRRMSASAPALSSTSTPAEASAFMTTTVHSPDSPSHVAVCVPGPLAEDHPKRLFTRRARRLASRNQAVVDPERIEIQVAHLVVLDALQVRVDVDRLADADEDAPALALAGDPHVAEHALGEHPIAARVRLEEVDALREVIAKVDESNRSDPRRGQEAVVVALGPVDGE